MEPPLPAAHRADRDNLLFPVIDCFKKSSVHQRLKMTATLHKLSGEERLKATTNSGVYPTAAGMSGPHTAFFYGTLMAPEVFFSAVYGGMNPGKVIQDLHSFHAGVLDGFVRHRVKWADYPGIIPEEGSSVHGVYATGLTDANMLKLDDFEGTEYVKEQVKVRLADTGEEKEATVYVYQHPEELDKGEWDFEHFKREKLALWSRPLP